MLAQTMSSPNTRAPPTPAPPSRPMSDVSPVERLVLERVARQCGGAVPDEAAAAVRAVLEEGELRADELEAVEHSVAEDAPDPVSVVLGLRVRAALHAGLAAAGVAADEEVLPEILVLREGASRERIDRALHEAVRRVRERMLTPEARAEPLLLVAAKRLYNKLHALLPEGKRADRATLAFHQAGDDTPSTTGASIEIVAADARIASVESAGEAAADSVRAASGLMGPAEPDEPDAPAAPVVPAAPPAPEAEAPPAEGDEPAGGDSGDPLIGQLLHLKYRIVRRLGEGGFGAVYEAEDERGAGNRVAIKVLSGEAAQSAAQHQSFKDEARRVTRLSHPNVVDWKVFDETEHGLPYFVMELVDGEEFSDTLRREGRLEPMRVAKLLLQILDALRSAHLLSESESILHLDLKPSNLFLLPPKRGREEQIKVIDFGIGQYIGDDQVEGDVEESAVPVAPEELDIGPGTLSFGSRPASRTSSGVQRSLGCTPEYASPEQCAHVLYEEDILALDGRSDLYSLGVIAFEMLAGRRPFVARSNRLDVLRMHREDPAPTLASLGVKAPAPAGPLRRPLPSARSAASASPTRARPTSTSTAS